VFDALRGRQGIEIAGPTPTFAADGPLPVYSILGSLENYGFEAAEGTFEFAGRTGPSHVCETQALPRLDASCDFVLSSHVLEHIANPLRVLGEWHRVLRTDGALLLLLPHHARTFDHRRPVTSWDHLLADFRQQTREDDRTHIPEAIRLTDIRHWTFKTWPNWQGSFENNIMHRCVHHHVFDLDLARRAVEFSGFQVKAAELVFPFHIVLLASKLAPAG